MGVLAEQFGGPSGLLGRLVTRILARGNAKLNVWAVQQLAGLMAPPKLVIELGSGPGIALAELARAFPDARIVGVDPSPVVQRSARRRNAAAIADGRVSLVTGDLDAAAIDQPADLILAVHVIYFWSDPAGELRRLHDAIAPGGLLALGYQLRRDMPGPAQRGFPDAGFRLYDSDDAISAMLREAGFTAPDVRILQTPRGPAGRLAVAIA